MQPRCRSRFIKCHVPFWESLLTISKIEISKLILTATIYLSVWYSLTQNNAKQFNKSTNRSKRKLANQRQHGKKTATKVHGWHNSKKQLRSSLPGRNNLQSGKTTGEVIVKGSASNKRYRCKSSCLCNFVTVRLRFHVKLFRECIPQLRAVVLNVGEIAPPGCDFVI